MGYTIEQKQNIERAKKADLVQYLKSNNIGITKEGLYYRHNKHNSLLIKENKWFWNSNKTNGDSINYLTSNDFEFRYSFNKAIEELCNCEGFIVHEQKEFNVNDVELTNNIRKSIAYLNKSRGIDNKIIEYLITNKLIAQTIKNNNIAFLIKDENKNIVGIDLNTTLSNKRYKGLEKNSKYGYGFNLTNTKNPKYSLYFESVIDLLSCIQYIGIDKAIKKLDTCIFVSLSGLKENIIKNTQKIYNNPKIFLCTDNIVIDKASKCFIGQIKSKYDNVDTFLPKGLYKDWNDVIQNKI